MKKNIVRINQKNIEDIVTKLVLEELEQFGPDNLSEPFDDVNIVDKQEKIMGNDVVQPANATNEIPNPEGGNYLSLYTNAEQNKIYVVDIRTGVIVHQDDL